MSWLMAWAGLRTAHVVILVIGLPALGWAVCRLTGWHRAKRVAEDAFWSAMREEYDDLTDWDEDDLRALRDAAEEALNGKRRSGT